MFMSRVQRFANMYQFSVQTDNSVRIFTKRELEKIKFKPEKGSQVFVGRLPIDAYEDEIFMFFSEIGSIFQIKLILKLSGETRGFGFVTFVNAHLANRAVAELSGKQLRHNTPLYVCLSTDYRTLTLKNAKGENATPQKIKKILSKIGKVVQVVEVSPSRYNIEFSEHHFAYRTLKEFRSTKTEIWGPSVELMWENQDEEIGDIRRREDEEVDQLRRARIRGFIQHLEHLVHLAERFPRNGRRARRAHSPDSGVGSCRESVVSLSPPPAHQGENEEEEEEAAASDHDNAARNENPHLPGRAGSLPPDVQEDAAALPIHGNSAAAALPIHGNAAAALRNRGNAAAALPNRGNAAALPIHRNAAAALPIHGNAAAALPIHGNAAAPLPIHGNAAAALPIHVDATANVNLNFPWSLRSISPFQDEAAALPIQVDAASNVRMHLPGPAYYSRQDGNQAPNVGLSRRRLQLQPMNAESDILNNVLPHYMPRDNQAPPFEKSRLSSAYQSRVACPEFGENLNCRQGNRASALELPRAPAFHLEKAKYNNSAPQCVPQAYQGVRPKQLERPYLASTPPSGRTDPAGILASELGIQQAASMNATMRYFQAQAELLKNVIPWYMPAERNMPSFDNSRFYSAYRSYPAREDESIQRLAEGMATSVLEDELPAQSRERIGNTLPRFLPNDNQTPPFENSRLAAYHRDYDNSIPQVVEKMVSSVLDDNLPAQFHAAPRHCEMGCDGYKCRFAHFMKPRPN